MRHFCLICSFLDESLLMEIPKLSQLSQLSHIIFCIDRFDRIDRFIPKRSKRSIWSCFFIAHYHTLKFALA